MNHARNWTNTPACSLVFAHRLPADGLETVSVDCALAREESLNSRLLPFLSLDFQRLTHIGRPSGRSRRSAAPPPPKATRRTSGPAAFRREEIRRLNTLLSALFLLLQRILRKSRPLARPISRSRFRSPAHLQNEAIREHNAHDDERSSLFEFRFVEFVNQFGDFHTPLLRSAPIGTQNKAVV